MRGIVASKTTLSRGVVLKICEQLAGLDDRSPVLDPEAFKKGKEGS